MWTRDAISGGYPTELQQHAALRNGASVFIRPIRPDDEARLTALYSRLSHDTAYQRFFTWWKKLPPAWARAFANVDYRGRLALVAEPYGGAGSALVGVARYEPSGDPATAEIALVIQDDWQGVGLGAVLLDRLLDAAAARGLDRFVAYVLSGNRRMLGLLDAHTVVLSRAMEQGVTEVRFARRSAS
jgi:RimJ/RimL family protein N-acetyltransferase